MRESVPSLIHALHMASSASGECGEKGLPFPCRLVAGIQVYLRCINNIGMLE
jgi:hypothetical protein